MSLTDYYDVLGCTKESTYEDLKRAYHALALQFHPDKCSTESDAPTKFQSVLEAWNVLGDPKSRREYDAACKQAELDSQSILVYERISFRELQTDDQGTLWYRCRCGSKYLVRGADLPEKDCSLQVPCQECTFVIVVDA